MPCPSRLPLSARPNVGKSSLFNRIAGRRIAIVHDTPGVTRDRSVAEAVFRRPGPSPDRHRRFRGIGGAESLSARMTGQTLAAIEEADALLFVIDARAGVTTGDEIIAQRPAPRRQARDPGRQQMRRPHRSRRAQRRVRAGLRRTAQAFRRTCAGHGRAGGRAGDAGAPRRRPRRRRKRKRIESEDEEADFDYRARPLRWRWWAGPMWANPACSINCWAKRAPSPARKRASPATPSPRPGRSRDREVLLHDTAGLRKKARVAGETLEEMSVASTLDAIRFADCVIVMMDATQPFEKQDLAIADLIAREGRAIVFAVNKWDLKENKQGAISELRECSTGCCRRWRARSWWRFRPGPAKALTGCLPPSWRPTAPGTAARPPRRSTASWKAALIRHAPPAVRGRRVRIRYMTQIKTRPPTFALFGNQLDRPARGLSALSDEWPARDFRSQGHAAAPGDAQYQKSLRSEEVTPSVRQCGQARSGHVL